MKRQFVKTSNAKRFRAGISMLEGRGALEAGWMLVTGRPGEGKTTTLQNWAAEVGAVMLTAQEGWTPTRMMTDLAEKLGVDTGRFYERKIEEMIAAEEIAIVLDEAGFALSAAAACLERLRGITDKSGTMLVMAAMEHDRPRFARRMQIASRISYVCEFEKSTLDDVGAACTQLGDVRMSEDLVARIHKETDARMRLVLTAINRVETYGRKFGRDLVTAADVSAMPLCEDFSRARTRKGGAA